MYKEPWSAYDLGGFPIKEITIVRQPSGKQPGTVHNFNEAEHGPLAIQGSERRRVQRENNCPEMLGIAGFVIYSEKVYQCFGWDDVSQITITKPEVRSDEE